MQVHQVADGFCEGAGQLLHIGEAIQFQWIKLGVVLAGSFLVAGRHLCLALHVHLAQLLLQAMYRAINFLQVEAYMA